MATPSSVECERSHLHKGSPHEYDAGANEKHMAVQSKIRLRCGLNRTAAAITFVLTIVILTLILTAHLRRFLTPDFSSKSSNDTDKHHGQWTNCGETVDDALSRGCHFDMMGNNWVPSLCHDATFAEDSARGNDSFAALYGLEEFSWYEKPLLHDPVEDLEPYLIAKARQGEEVTAYTTESWHVAHCMYWLSVGVNAMNRLNQGERDVWVPRVVRKPEHARHCSMISGYALIRNASEEQDLTPKVFFGYATCVRLA